MGGKVCGVTRDRFHHRRARGVDLVRVEGPVRIDLKARLREGPIDRPAYDIEWANIDGPRQDLALQELPDVLVGKARCGDMFAMVKV